MSARKPHFCLKFLSAIFVLWLLNNPSSLFSQDIQWDTAIVAKGAGNSVGVRVIVDSVMNSIVMSTGQGVVIFGPDTLDTKGMKSYFVTYYDSLRDIRWTRMIRGKYLWLQRGAMAFDNKGALYVVGQFADSVWIENQVLSSTKILEGFFVKYNKQGKMQWVKKIVSGRTLMNLAMKADRSNRIYIGGSFTDSISIGGKNAVSSKRPYYQTAFLAQLDTAGNTSWLMTVLMNESDDFFGFSDLDADDNGNVYMTGTLNYITDPDFGNGKILTGSFSELSFIAKYDASGNCQWVKTPENGGGISESFGISIDKCGYIYNTGMILGSVVFGKDTLKYPHGKLGHGATIYIAKYDQDGNYKRSAVFASLGDQCDFGLKYTSANCCKQGYLLGLFNDTIVIGYDSLIGKLKPVTSAADNVFLAKFDSAFKPLWARNCSDVASNQEGGDMAVDTTERVYFTGYSSRTETKCLYALKSCALIDTTVAPPPKPIDTTKIPPDPDPDPDPDPLPDTISKVGIASSFCSTAVYPIPASCQLTVNMPCSNDYKISIIDMNGRIIYTKNIADSSETIIDVNNIPSGTYYIQLNDRHRSKIYRCVIER